jgi:AraC family transcriptional regulator
MADGNLAPRNPDVRNPDGPPVTRYLGRAAFNGLTASLVRNQAGVYDTGVWSDHRVFVQTSRELIRAQCELDGKRLDHMQSFGDVTIQPAGVAGVWEDYGSCEMVFFQISPSFLRAAAQDLQLDPDRVDLTPWLHARDPQIEHIALAMKAGFESDEPFPRLYGESLGLALASRLLGRFAGAGRATRQGLSRRQLQRVTEHIEAHLDEDLSLHELAAIARVSISHFTVLFRRSTGLSAHRYVIQRRVAAARRLLSEGRMSIAEIALETGFAHQSHLSRCMRRLTGLTPGEVARGA